MQHAYQPIIAQLDDIDFEVSGKLLESSRILLKASSCSYYLGALDTGIWEKIAATGEAITIRVQRTNCAVQADLVRESFSRYIDDNMPILYEAQQLLHKHSKPFTPYINHLAVSTFEIDNSATNEDWFDQLSAEIDKMDKALEDFAARCKETATLLQAIMKEDEVRDIA